MYSDFETESQFLVYSQQPIVNLTSRTEDDERSYAASATVDKCPCIELASLKSLVYDILLRGLSLEKPVQCHAKKRSLIVQGLLVHCQTARTLYALINVLRYQHLHVYAYLPPQGVLCKARSYSCSGVCEGLACSPSFTHNTVTKKQEHVDPPNSVFIPVFKAFIETSLVCWVCHG